MSMLYNYCLNCGKNIKSNNDTRFECNNCKSIFYNNSKPCVGAIILKGNKVLLGKRSIEPSKGMWDIPGGFLNYGEDPKDGVIREVLEETGLNVEPNKILDIIMDNYGESKKSTLNIFYIVTIKDGVEKAGDDLEELQWFALNNLPENQAFENGRRILKSLKEDYYSV